MDNDGMTIEDAIKYCEKIKFFFDWDMFDHEKITQSLDMALAALCAQQEAKKNEPLTLDELRQMDGEPVYVVPQNGGYVAGATAWAKVNAKYERCEAPNLNFYFCEYVTYWLAYRHPIKEDTNGHIQ